MTPAVTPAGLLELFADAGAAVAAALESVTGAERRARTARAGQYALDLVADAAALAVLHRVEAAVLSEESGWSGAPRGSGWSLRGTPPNPRATGLSIVLDPVDGSTNASRGLPYWCTSLCAVDGEGPLAALVVNQVTGETTTAIRGEGAWRRPGLRGYPPEQWQALVPAKAERVEDSMISLSGVPAHWLPWKQFRSLGSIALTLCDLAAGSIEGVVDGYAQHAPWDYLGGLLVCTEAGAPVVDAAGRSLLDVEVDVRRQLLGAGTPALLDELRRAVA